MKFLLALLLSSSAFAAQNFTFIQGPALVQSTSSTASAGGTTTLTTASNDNQQFTGSTTQTVVLPVATGLQVGRSFYFSNRSTGIITVKYQDASTAQSMAAGTVALFILESNGTANGTWDISYASGAPTQGNLTDAGTDGITVTNGTNAVFGSGTSVAQHVADSTHNGYLSSTDWSTFNSKQALLTIGNLTDVGTDGIVVTGGTGSVIGAGTSVAQHVADTTHSGYLSSTDWNTFSGKQAAGNYITALTGDVTASGPGSVASTLATVNANTGPFGSSTAIPSFTVNGKGLITAASTNAVIAPAGTLSGTTLASGVVSSSLTSVGTITSGTWNGTTVGVGSGGTGQTTYTDGQLLIGNTTGNTLTKSTLTAGSNVTITNGHGSITIAATAGGAAAFNVVSKTTTYSASINDYILASSASFTITLPTAVGVSGQAIAIQHNGTSLSQVYTLNTTSAQTIGGIASGSYALYTNGETLVLVSDGANWQIQNHKTDTGWINGGVTALSATSAYVFTVTAANATVGATYTNNGQTFTVSTTIAAGTTLTCSGTGTPGASGTLTKVSGTGDATITFSAKTTTGQPVKGSVQSSDTFWWEREGNSMKGRVEFSQTNNSGAVAGAGDYTLYMPAGIVLDTTKMSVYTTVIGGPNAIPIPTSDIGGGWSGTASQWGFLRIVPYSSTQVRGFGNVWNSAFSAAAGGAWAATLNSIAGTNFGFAMTIEAPVSGWQP